MCSCWWESRPYYRLWRVSHEKSVISDIFSNIPKSNSSTRVEAWSGFQITKKCPLKRIRQDQNCDFPCWTHTCLNNLWTHWLGMAWPALTPEKTASRGHYFLYANEARYFTFKQADRKYGIRKNFHLFTEKKTKTRNGVWNQSLTCNRWTFRCNWVWWGDSR